LLAGDKHIDAVFAASDVVAMGVMGAIREAGLSIPGDIAVVGFDDVPMARYVDPPLTTIHLPAIELARTAGEMIIPLTDGHQPEKTHVVLDTELVVRKSSGS
jgi:DNA-binding LacI/PurR family transcriptional regulator